MSNDPAPVALIIGASRGIGRQVALDLAHNGYRGRTLADRGRPPYRVESRALVVVAAKTISPATDSSSSTAAPFPPDPNSPQSTITTVAREILEAGGVAAAIQVDTRDPESVRRLVDATVERFGRLDVLVYNSGAIWWASVEDTPMKRFQLMQRVNVEGLYGAVQAALPHFGRNGWRGRVVVVSPPIYSRFFRGKTAYAMGKVGMSVLTKGLAMDWVRQGRDGMAITSIWPAVAIQSAATPDPAIQKDLRKPTIFSDAILAILRAPTAEINGRLELDEDFLRSRGVTDFSGYSLIPGAVPRRIMPETLPDLSVAEEDDEGVRMDSAAARREKL